MSGAWWLLLWLLSTVNLNSLISVVIDIVIVIVVVVFAVAVAAVFFVVLVLVVVVIIVIATVIIIVQSLSRFSWLKWITLIFHNYFFCFPFQENNFTIWLGFWYKEFQAKVLLERVLMTSLPSKSRCLIIIIAFFFFFELLVVQLTCTLHRTVFIRGMFA